MFFAGIAAGHLGFSIDSQMLNYAEKFWFDFVCLCLGVTGWAWIFGIFPEGGNDFELFGYGSYLGGYYYDFSFHILTGVSLPDMVGILSGAVTNTPALGAAQQTLKQMHIDAADPALGCAVTYPLGVVGVILAVIVLRKMFPKKTKEVIVADDKSKQTFIAGFEVCNPGIFGKSV